MAKAINKKKAKAVKVAHLNTAYSAIEHANTLITQYFGGIDKFARIRSDLEEEENK